MTEQKVTTPYRQQLRERVLKCALEAFTAHGIRQVKMDDIARKLTISKRTLYELYATKEELLAEGLMMNRKKDEDEIGDILSKGGTVMDIVLLFCKRRVEVFKHISTLFYDDLKRYPRVMEILKEGQAVHHRQFADFLRRGVTEGYFRADIDCDIMPYMFEAIGNYIMTQQLYRQYGMDYIFRQMAVTLLRGICTERGASLLDSEL